MAAQPVSAPGRAGFAGWRSDESALHAVLPYVIRRLRREPALAISIGYMLVATAGIFYNVSFYKKFGIPVLTLSQIGDFLVAGVQQPIAIVLVLSTLPLCWLFDRLNATYRRRKLAERERLLALPSLSYRQRWQVKMADWTLGRPHQELIAYLFVIPLYGWVFVANYAEYRAEAIKRGESDMVRVWLADDSSGLGKGRELAWLGATGGYVFVYDAEGGKSLVLPVENVARIEPAQRAKRVPARALVPTP